MIEGLIKDWIYVYHNMIINYYRIINGAPATTIWVKNNGWLENQIASGNVDISDYNLYREIDEGNANGILTTQTNRQLFTDYNIANPELSDWGPGPGSNLIDNSMVSPTEAVEFAYMLQGDLDHPFETEWRGQSMPGTDLYDIGPLERKYAGIVQWYNYW